MTSALFLTAPLRSRVPLSWLLLAAAALGCSGGGAPSQTSTTPDGSGLQNLFDVPIWRRRSGCFTRECRARSTRTSLDRSSRR